MKQSVICSQLSHQEGSNVENNKDSKVKTISYSNNEIISSNVPDVDQKETKRIFSHINDCFVCKYIASNASFKYCIPYNNDTKHLIGTTEEAPEYYRYWED